MPTHSSHLGFLIPALLAWSACAVATPEDEAVQVRPQPGKPLRVGLVVRQQGDCVAAGFARPTPMDAAAPKGEVYAEQTVLPASIRAEDLGKTLKDLGSVTDLLPLAIDMSGLPTRELLKDRLDAEAWELGRTQHLDAVLVVEGVRDAGLRYDHDQSVFSLGTVLWWLTWPFGLWIPDRSYAAEAMLDAQLYLLPSHDVVPLEVKAGAHKMRPWTRANAPALGFVVPPVWLSDDRKAVADDASQWATATLPIALARRIKEATLPDLDTIQVQFREQGDQLQITVDADSDTLGGTLTALPTGPLASAAPAGTRLDFTAPQPLGTREGRLIYRHVATCNGAIRKGQPLLRLELALVGRQRSMTWASASLPGLAMAAAR